FPAEVARRDEIRFFGIAAPADRPRLRAGGQILPKRAGPPESGIRMSREECNAEGGRMPVRVAKKGSVTTVILSRPEVRQHVDRESAVALADGFREFEAADGARVAVFYGDHGTFCAGAALKAIAAGQGNRTSPEGDGPMGPSRMMLAKPVIAAVSGYAVAGG